MSDSLRILSIGVHPAEGELESLMDDRANVKAEEVRKACGILEVEDLHFFGADDAVLLVTEEVVRRLARLLRQLRPEIILTHYPKEGDGLTSPYAITGQIVISAIGLANGVDPCDRNPPHRVAQVFFYGAGAASVRRNLWDSTGGYHNDVFIDITDVRGDGLPGESGYDGAYARKRIETSDGAFGVAAGCPYAEGFISLHAETLSYLPLGDQLLEISRSSDHERMGCYAYRLPVD